MESRCECNIEPPGSINHGVNSIYSDMVYICINLKARCKVNNETFDSSEISNNLVIKPLLLFNLYKLSAIICYSHFNYKVVNIFSVLFVFSVHVLAALVLVAQSIVL